MFLFKGRAACDNSTPPDRSSNDEAVRRQGEQNWERCLLMLHSDAWKLHKKTAEGDWVYTTCVPDLGKVYRIVATLNFPAEFLHKLLFDDTENLHKWNKQFVASQKIKIIDSNTDVNYIVTAHLVSGLVASRDFTCVRHWRNVNETYISAGVAVTLPLAPPPGRYVRGDTKLSFYAVSPVPGKEDWCTFQFVNCARLGGWLPTYIVDLFFIDGMRDYVAHLRQHSNKLRGEGCF